VLDRALDGGASDGGGDLSALHESVRRDLELLLNTRRLYVPVSDDYPELQRSVLLFGVPDITSLGRDAPATRTRLLAHIEEAIALFEPRLSNVRVSIVDAQTPNGGLRQVHFRINAMLAADPEPLRVSFDTVVDRSTGGFNVDVGAA
jgi:type VI secretion system protein ImpF